MKFKPYEEYKKVDLPWIDEIPSHWKMKKIKYIFDERNERGREKEPLLVASQKYGVILKSMYEARTVEAQRNLESLKYVSRGDFVISLRSFQGGIEYAHYSGIISPAYTIMIPKKEISIKYFKHLAKSYNVIKLLKTCVTGIREGQNIDYNKLRSKKISLPPKEEQDKIADFLDHNLAKIDRFIELTERQIELLKEQKEVLINDAVTKGIDKDVDYKDSGIDWIGEIPEHWEVTRLKYLVSSNLVSLSNNEEKDKEIQYIDIGSVGFFKLKSEPVKMLFGQAPSRARRVVKNGDIIISTVRTYLKSMLYIDESLSGKIVSTGFSVLTPKEGINSNYLKHSISGNYFIQNIIKDSIGVAYPAINDDRLMCLKIVYCRDKKEQEEIVAYIQEETSKIDRTMELYKNQIELIKEYRTSLIASVVTGKIDVRDF